MDRIFKALADESRRKLLDLLHKRDGQSLGALCDHLAMSRQAVTKHLVILESAKLVATEWRGREKIHHLNPIPIRKISRRWIENYAAKKSSAP
jgi:DNA-binding transcriptional ArsR family regulator